MRKYVIVGIVLASGLASAKGIVWGDAQEKYAVTSGLLNTILAKELCSCKYVSGLPTKECLNRANLPGGAGWVVSVDDKTRNVVTVTTSWLGRRRDGKGPSATAIYDSASPEYGCHLVKGPLER